MIRFIRTLILLNYQECSVAILTVTVMFVFAINKFTIFIIGGRKYTLSFTYSHVYGKTILFIVIGGHLN